MISRTQQVAHRAALASLVALVLLCLAWELWLAPLRPGGTWLAIKALPLLVPLRGVWKRDVYTMQWSSMFILFYFTEGVVRATSVSGIDAGMGAWLATAEVALSVIFFVGGIVYLRPFKKAAKQMARDAIARAAASPASAEPKAGDERLP